MREKWTWKKRPLTACDTWQGTYRWEIDGPSRERSDLWSGSPFSRMKGPWVKRTRFEVSCTKNLKPNDDLLLDCPRREKESKFEHFGATQQITWFFPPRVQISRSWPSPCSTTILYDVVGDNSIIMGMLHHCKHLHAGWMGVWGRKATTKLMPRTGKGWQGITTVPTTTSDYLPWVTTCRVDMGSNKDRDDKEQA